MLNNKELLEKLGFSPKENTSEVFIKTFASAANYVIEADFQKNKFNFGSKIKSDSGTTQNFSQEENWVVLECVNRLLEKGYKPEDITLEKIYPTGHGTSGRLDVLVKKDKKAYLMIECKTWGSEYQKALKKMQKDGGQLFTYFQQDRDTQYLMLYASTLSEGAVVSESQIIKIEEHYREAGNVKDLYDRWNKLSKSNGIFNDGVNAYEFQNKALAINDLNTIKQEDSSFIFNRFLEILRQNVVSDKPNAFNKIFTLFLCKIVDETHAKDTQQLDFQWIEGIDNNISFQKRLTDLYKAGMKELLNKEVKDLSDDEFNKKFSGLNEDYREKILREFTDIRLKKNNEFAFKEVFDDASFEDNAKVVKAVVELLQGYKIRYNKKHQYLSDFFELLLATGLKQESGQFFTPVPVAKYIIKSLPIKEIIEEKFKTGNPKDLLPFVIDYAAGSGHFLTESMDEVQKIIDKIQVGNLNQQTERKIRAWKEDQFSWAIDYVYGIEKDYRLVKTAKVGCYLHGDGLAKVIHGDGLQTFGIKPLDHGSLCEVDGTFLQDNKQFDLVISNPPYSVSAFRGNMQEENAKKSFDLFDRLTDQSSEIECLFIERTKQLLKDGGLAGVILPSSILSNSGIYTKTREILFKYFEIVGITELGSGTFMATGTSTIILFLRKRNNYEWESMESAAKKFFQNYDDVTVNGVENIFSQYVKHAWTGITLEDYIDFCKGITNKNTENHEMYKEYQKKLKSKDFNDLRGKIIEKEIEKLLYFILAYNQKIILTKSGQKKEEKKFLGYEFSNRRGYEGIHPIQKTKSIDECTKMYNSENQEDETRANSYVYGAFLGKKNQVVHASLEKNVFEIGLLGAMDFNRAEFEKTISLTLKKKIKTENAWGTKNLVPLNQVANIQKGTSITQEKVIEGNIPVIAGGQTPAYFHNVANRNGNIITVSASGAYAGFVNYFHDPIFASDCNTIQSLNENAISTKLIYEFLKSTQEEFYLLQRGQAQPHVYGGDLENIKIPLPPKAIQEKIIDEIKHIESSNEKLVRRVEELRGDIKKNLSSSTSTKEKKLGNILTLQYGSPLTEGDRVGGKYPVMGSNGVVGYHNNFKICGPTIIIGRKGSAGKVTWVEQDNYPIDTTFYVEKTDDEVDYRFLYYILCDINLEKLVLGVGVPGLNRNDVYGQVYKVPPFEEQKRIVAQVVQIENEITEIKKELQESSDNKNVVLRKYLV